MAHRVQLRRTKITDDMKARGLDSESAQARELDVATSILHRAFKGERETNAFLALRVLWTLGSDATRRDIVTYFDGVQPEPAIREPVAS
ncbi:hypothetical protein [Nonomuraea gerenzanensis]|uniref:Uncharacterized protein n=1 Tax=Nonomuraea gerenzanensis TaxID=93944 RepID=A0A1M4BL94_9ACTN|nr:hypothetical protein [Nonomuraea gerenzanensis]UBU09988.1 hypothetical protein LCN96_37305 [Nonomuraea gerenzanensis]SAP16303.1 hypothetical protein BN4615_P10966 [Nonomuraea gerenzanensis]